MINRWFTRYLYGVQNGVENEPRTWIVREANACPPRSAVVNGDQSNTTTLTVQDSSQLSYGRTLTIPVDERDRDDDELDDRDLGGSRLDARRARRGGGDGCRLEGRERGDVVSLAAPRRARRRTRNGRTRPPRSRT